MYLGLTEAPQILADHLTLSQPRRQRYNTTCSPPPLEFSELPTALVLLATERPESRCKQLGLCIFDVDFLARFNVVRASDFRLALSKKIVA